MDIILSLFTDVGDATINKALVEMRECNYIKAITMSILLEDFHQHFHNLTVELFDVIKNYLQRFPSDTINSNASIRTLHNALKIWFEMPIMKYTI